MPTKTKSVEQAQHTPAPWTANGSSINAIFMGEKLQVALMSRTAFCGNLTDAERAISKAFQATEEADARLIAAAPSLLAALERISALAKDGAITRSETGKPMWSLVDELKSITQAAITKAKGTP